MRVADDSGNPDIHIYDNARNNFTQLTFTAENECCPVWMPDGERIVFASDRDGSPNLYMKNADGTGEAERLTEGSDPKFRGLSTWTQVARLSSMWAWGPLSLHRFLVRCVVGLGACGSFGSWCLGRCLACQIPLSEASSQQAARNDAAAVSKVDGFCGPVHRVDHVDGLREMGH